jgi:outer membrane receptor protein involved in Fe transport
MKRTFATLKARLGLVTAVVAVLLLAGLPAGAQSSSASLRGKVLDETGTPLAEARVTATNKDTGFSYRATTKADGSYNISGLPPGTYEVGIEADAYKAGSQTIRALIGQTLDADFRLRLDTSVSEAITVTGEAPLEVKTSTVSTNVTEEQIESLPQNSRNFLNFAALAPGMRVSDNEFRKEVSAGALAARDTNVFIDGASFKSDILEGGVVGQDSSRGNPFPQNAVQEFRVLTQNYKAEYQKASSAVISAVTKSGGNQLRGDLFAFFQDKSLVSNDSFAEQRGQPKPEYERWQGGLSVGGPIIADKLHFFASYENNRQDRQNQVFLTNPIYRPQFGQYEGNFTSPFRSSLYFGKLSYQGEGGQLIDLSANVRHETDIRSFGSQVSYDSAENVQNDVSTVLAKHTRGNENHLNEATLSYQRYEWNPTPINQDQIGQDYFGIIRIGGRDTEQDFKQDRLALRDDLTFFGADWHGNHVVKGGVTFDYLKYDVAKSTFINPKFNYRSDISLDFPFEAQLGFGNPNLNASNRQLGLYLQDDWNVTSRLTLNLGVRWDYETDMLNNDYKTPAAVEAALSPYVSSDYFTDGDDRKADYSEIQPRIGLSYDVTGNGKTVAFAGVGRYYDRVLYNYTLDERYRLQYSVLTYRFSADGAPRDGQPTLVWRPEYLSRAGLLNIVTSGQGPKPEVFLIANDTHAPSSDQWSLGVRQILGPYTVTATYAGVRSYNGFTFLFGNRNPDGTCCRQLSPDFGNVLISSDVKKTWYNAAYLQIDRPYTSSGRWGGSLTYTYGKAEQNGGDLFSLDFPTVDAYPRYPTENDERHRVVMSAIVGLGWGFRASTLITLGSGTPYNISDASRGFGPNEFRFLRNEGRPEKYSFILQDAFAYRSVDLRLQKDIPIGNKSVGLIAEAINAFNYKNFGCYDGFIAPTSGAPNPNYGKPGCQLDTGRRLQAGLTFSF